MRRVPVLAAVTLVTGCGRLGYDLMATGGHSRAGATGIASGGATGNGGAAHDGGGNLGSGGTDAGVGTGGQRITDAGTGGQFGAGGADAGPYTCTPGAREICDGRDNNCDGVIDEVGACPSKCVGRAWGNHGYMLCDNTTYGWPDAKTQCETAGLHLANIESKAENDFVFGFAFATRNGDVWIGGSDLATEGDWRWTDGTPFYSGIASDGGAAVGGAYTHWWIPGEPNNLNGASDGDGDCLVISQTQGFWLDEGCNFFNRALCETP